jgi:hypothetical protein
MKKSASTIAPGNIPFKKALNQITGKDSEGKALPRFRALLTKEVRQTLRARGRAFDQATVDPIVQDNLEYHRKNGFELGEVEKFKRLYHAQPRCGPRKESKFSSLTVFKRPKLVKAAS